MKVVVLQILAWSSVAILSMGYWSQVWKIHVHKEVRDLSFASYLLLAIGFGILTIQAVEDNSTIFIIKQIATFIPVAIILYQIKAHKDDHWHDDINPICNGCQEELEIEWKHCPYCGTNAPELVLLPHYEAKLAKQKLKKEAAEKNKR